ncbi:hypothetical protein TA3x_000079 [Tundrisphaera sp. TA3]|uniref:hypothetical protein n=1 Tax=Tundrisphaera sp. TA3 TaxID=3435775 RepID=UPI003EBB634D
MHGVPPDLPLDRFLGEACTLIEIGRFEIVFVFPDAGTIRVHRGWELCDGSDRMIDRMQEHDERDGYRVHRLIGLPVRRYDIDPPASFTLHFEGGFSLTIFDDDDCYESFSIEPDGIYI